MPAVLIVEDEAPIVELIAVNLRHHGFQSTWAPDGAAAQRQNILRAAFSGQLVPQDSGDEPASALLERIRAERAVRGAAKKPRGRKPKENLQ